MFPVELNKANMMHCNLTLEIAQKYRTDGPTASKEPVIESVTLSRASL